MNKTLTIRGNDFIQNGKPVQLLSGAIHYFRVVPEYWRDRLLKLKAMGVNGIAYLDGMGMPLELSYNPRHGEQRYRRACAQGVARLLQTAREVYGGCGT